jgi:hypothetical protein
VTGIPGRERRDREYVSSPISGRRLCTFGSKIAARVDARRTGVFVRPNQRSKSASRGGLANLRQFGRGAEGRVSEDRTRFAKRSAWREHCH